MTCQWPKSVHPRACGPPNRKLDLLVCTRASARCRPPYEGANRKGGSMSGLEVLNRLYGLFGEAVFLPIPLGEKGPQIPGWQKRTFAESKRSPALLEAALRGGNVGGLLRRASGGLLALDIDSDE